MKKLLFYLLVLGILVMLLVLCGIFVLCYNYKELMCVFICLNMDIDMKDNY